MEPARRANQKQESACGPIAAARDLIASVHRVAGAGYVFTTNGKTPVSGWSKTKKRLDVKMLEVARAEDAKAIIPPWTVHDLRRTAAAGLQRLGVPLPVTERILNHVSGSFGGIVGVYQRHEYAEERRDALEKWAQYVEGITRP
jgi:integrase